MLKVVIHFYSEGEIVRTILQEYVHALRVELTKYLLRRKRFQTKAIGKHVRRLIDDTCLP
jgi:hypothetical protein